MGYSVRFDDSDITVIGRACRLPGAANVGELWELLHGGRCAVSTIPADRWPLSRFRHPRLREPGRSYTWAAGVLPNIWGFDPAVFGISPREAQQMDPQQRLLLELAFEACEDAGFAPSKLAGGHTGVYVGASALDYSTIGLHDPAVADAYYATGNTLSIVSNRLSYVFDLHGPSLTIDTACSSSLVALHQARQALTHGEIDAAIVGGVNVLVSPFGFISFSQATMLSPDRPLPGLRGGSGRLRAGRGRGRPGPEDAEEGDRRRRPDSCGRSAAARSIPTGARAASPCRPRNIRPNCCARPTIKPGVAPDSVAFVEAHGTGTRVGDPVEATAARRRARPRREAVRLPIGSIKTNIGHTEPASGLAGLLKAMLALEHDEIPRSLHVENPNPSIDFAGLNLRVASEAIPLSRSDRPGSPASVRSASAAPTPTSSWPIRHPPARPMSQRRA